MGASGDAAKRDSLNEIAQLQTQEQMDQVRAAENRRALTESLLGTDAQVEGTLGGVKAEALPYIGRYSLNPDAMSMLMGGLPQKAKKKGVFDKIKDALNPKNMFSLKNLTNPMSWLGAGPLGGAAGGLLGDLMGGGGGGNGGVGGGVDTIPGLDLVSQETRQGISDFLKEYEKGTFYGNKQYGKREAPKFLQGLTENANKLMEEAQKYAEAGDYKSAEAVKNMADQLLGSGLGRGEFSKFQGTTGDVFNMSEDPIARTYSQLNSPAARTIGALVRRGKGLTDRNSQEYKDTLAELNAPTLEGQKQQERALAAGSRGTERMMRQIGASRGAAYGGGQAQASYADMQRKLATDRANIVSQTHQQIAENVRWLSTDFAPKFSANMATLARSWAAGEAGNRDDFMAAMTGLNQSVATFTGQLSQMYHDQAMTEMQIKSQEKMATQQLVGSIVGSVVGAGAKAATGMMCHGAAEYFGWETPDWFAAREWIVNGWKGAIADAFRAFYSRFSRQLAWVIRNVPGMKALWRPFFMWARDNGGSL